MSYKEKSNLVIFKQLSWWKRFALSLPYALLAFIIFFYSFGFETLLDKLLVFGSTIAMIIAVTWWWWVMYTINHFTSVLNSAAENLKEFKTDIEEIKKDL